MTILHSAPADRNVEYILENLRRHLPEQGEVLEIASGTGQHIMRFSAALPHLTWQPSDPDPAARASISARLAADARDNVWAPIDLDVREQWPDRSFAAVIAANVLHISPFSVVDALLAGAGAVVVAGGVLHIYGPFKKAGEHTSRGNADFDQSLKSRNSEWGIRDMEVVIEVAQGHGFVLLEQVAMPANNFSLIFARGARHQ